MGVFIKIVILLVIIYYLYKFFGGEFKLPQKKSNLQDNDPNTLVECCKCGVFVTQKEAIKDGKCFYCLECKEEI